MLQELEKIIDSNDPSIHEGIRLSLKEAKNIRDELREYEKIKKQLDYNKTFYNNNF